MLERAGCRVVSTADVPQALIMIELDTPDLVITDLMMTGLDSGFELAQYLKKHSRLAPVPIILCTAISSTFGIDLRPQSKQELTYICADAFFDKPLDPALLLPKTTELLEARRDEEETGLGEWGRSLMSETD